MPGIVALVSSQPQQPLVRYLVDLGFEVSRVALGARPRREGTLVWLVTSNTDERLVADSVGAWLGALHSLRAIIVTEHPARMRRLLAHTTDRVRILPAPVFGWQLVDAIRETDPR